VSAPDSSQRRASTGKTTALENLEGNLEQLLGFYRLVGPRSKPLSHQVVLLKKRVERNIDAIRTIASMPQSGRKTAAAKRAKAIGRAVDAFSEASEHYFRMRFLTQEWMCVMLVSFVEAYLEDGLVLVATKNPQLMESAEPLPPSTILEADTLDELKLALRLHWARRTLQGGPQKWLPRLRQMGARGYRGDCSRRLGHLWDTRNLIVHTQGRAHSAHFKKYNLPEPPGKRVRVTGEVLKWWLAGVGAFVDETDRFFLSYGKRSSS
jgi:hypothetical protein